MKRTSASLRLAIVFGLVMTSRIVWPRTSGASFARATILIAPSSICLKPNGGDDQPTSIWPDITWVSVEEGLPVAVGFALRPNSFMKASTIECVDEPLVEYAIVLP